MCKSVHDIRLNFHILLVNFNFLNQLFHLATQTVRPYWKFRCDNGHECVSEYRLCDGRRDCSDGSDEWYRNCSMYRNRLHAKFS